MSEETKHIRYIEGSKPCRGKKYAMVKQAARQKRFVEFLEMPARLLAYRLDICPIGDGALYEKLVLASLVKALGGIVDQDLVRQRVPIRGGFADIELPFCPEMLPEYPHWIAWQRDYAVKAIIVEVKNLRKKASYEDANQLKGYVDGNHKGRCGFLVSRSGFTNDALETLRCYGRADYLLLPLEHDDLKALIKIRVDKSIKVARYLRRIETILLRLK